jgi:signal transduction histidine kinase
MWKRPTISTYLISMNMVLLGLLFPSFSYLFMREMIHLRDIQLERNINTINQSLATRASSLVRSTTLSAREAIAGFDFTFLQNLLVEVTHDDPEIHSCMILDRKQTVVAHSDPSLIGSRLTGADDSKIAALMATTFPEKPGSSEVKVQLFWPPPGREDGPGNGLMNAAFPIYSGNSLWGLIRCDYSLKTTKNQIAEVRSDWTRQLFQMKLYFAYLLCGFLVIGFIIAIILTRSFVRATQVLHTGVHQVAEGELNHEITLRGLVCEEFAGLVTSFNAMTEKLRISYQQLDEYSKSLEEKVKERTKELQEAQGMMIKQAHEAGLAEMAVGVLHNIGNAITPAQVAATMLSNHLLNSPLRTRLDQSLTPLREFLEEKRLITPQEKEHFAKILTLLPSSLIEEFDRAVNELNDIRDKHHHIENIIKLQMRYARMADNPDLVDINRLAQDAIKILADAIGKRQITVHMHLEDTQLVRAEETKLLQVMVNLIKNGYEAIDAYPGSLRELTITTGMREGSPAQVLFSVQDTGCGFTEEVKNHLFSFGYSTKERGSGFGLHSCANAIIANHGTIEAISPGPGMGSRFTVSLRAVQPGDNKGEQG